MPNIIKFGSGSSIALDLPPDVVVADCEAPAGLSESEIGGAVAAALQSPLGYPPLSLATVPGDRVALVVGEGIPQVDRIVTAIAEDLLSASDLESIDVVCAAGDESICDGEWTKRLSNDGHNRVRVVQHDARDRNTWAYLTATKDAEPIYLNRAIVDADFVLPIGCLRPHASPGYLGVCSAIYPLFADEQAQKRLRDPASVPGDQGPDQRCRQVEEIGWLMGVQFTLQAVSGADGSVLQMLAGLLSEVADRGRAVCGERLTFTVPQPASLVVATIDGGPQQQTWDNLARALAAASRVVSDDGVIAVCCDLAAGPGPALASVVESESAELALREINQQRSFDAIPAAWLLHVLEQHTVFLLSRLDESIVQDLGLAYLADEEDLARLGQQFPSCTILRGAHQLVPNVADDPADAD
jgi:nickel-dependent lactate racemase